MITGGLATRNVQVDLRSMTMGVRFDANAIATCKAAGFHAAQFTDDKLVAEFFGEQDYSGVLGPDGFGHLCIGSDELLSIHDQIYDVAGIGQAVRRFSNVNDFTTMVMRDIQSREERNVSAARRRLLAGA